MSFAGVSEKNLQARNALMDDVAYEKVAHALRRGHQAMVFVHSRKATGLAARALAQRAQERGETALFDTTGEELHGLFAKDVHKSRNREVQEIFALGCGIHHAGMLRPDRTLTERLFSAGIIRVLCCTATLAWGVNLPAHTVVIKGTQLYNPEKGGFVDLGMLDVQQIFGRAGRPQFQDAGEATIVTTHDKLAHYLGLLTQAVPIESQFAERLVDHLNAEVVLGTVANVGEGARWLSYTYMHTRALKNPLAYGISWEALLGDPALERHRRQLVQQAAHVLERCRMARFDQRAGALHVTELGRVASHFYISHGTIATFNERLKPVMDEAEVFAILALSSEFDNLAIRPDELLELDELQRSVCPYPAPGGPETRHGKACILAQAFVSRARVDGFSLSADLNYVSQNAPRIARALFEICLRRG
ncbi:Sec63 Brl domain-containing protein, partial [Helicosporidium sp. ATCC 50920]